VDSPAVPITDAPDAGHSKRLPAGASICMHVLNPARTDQRVLREATALADAGYSVTIVDIEHDRSRPREETLRGVRFKHIMLPDRLRKHYTPANRPAWLAFKALRVWRALFAVTTTPADVYHAHDTTALPACLVAARLRRKPLIFDAHELPLAQPHVERLHLVHAVSAWFIRLALARCAAVVTVSPSLVPVLQRLYGGPRAEVVRNVPVYQPPVQSDRLRERLGLSAQTHIALYQGGIQTDRALDVLVHAARYLDPDIVIVLMGNGPQAAMIEHLIGEESVGDRAKLLPAVPYEELLSWTASADLGLILYRASESLNVRYCLPNKLFEYLAAGVPILASELDAVAELLARYDAGDVIHTLEPRAIAHAIAAMVADRGAWMRMHESALTAARTDLNWETEKEQIVALYERVLAPRVPAPAVPSVSQSRAQDT
jgi:glycosyltransferase involved in cell wall biosynthesis